MQQNIWWVARLVLPRDLKLTREERWRLEYLFIRDPRIRGRQLWWLITKVIIINLLAVPVLFLAFVLPFHIALGLTISTIAYTAVATFPSMLIVKCAMKRPVREALREIGYEVCLACGHWLRGLDDDTIACPECGAERYRAVGHQ